MRKFRNKDEFQRYLRQQAEKTARQREKREKQIIEARGRFYEDALILLSNNDNKLSLTKFKTALQRQYKLPKQFEQFLREQGFTLTQSAVSSNLIFVSI